MTENPRVLDQVIRPTAEQLRQSIPHSGANEHLRNAERGERTMSDALERIGSDESLSPEGRRAKAQEIVDRYSGQITENYREARKKLEAAAESRYKFSIPMPDGKSLAVTKIADSAEMVAVQNEANAILARVPENSLNELSKAGSKNPNAEGIQETESPALRVLREEFSSAMELGGTEGRIRALAVARVCEGKGLPLDVVVDSFRGPNHREALDSRERIEEALFTLPSERSFASLTRNPYEDAQSREGHIGTLGRPKVANMSRGGGWGLVSRSSRHW